MCNFRAIIAISLLKVLQRYLLCFQPHQFAELHSVPQHYKGYDNVFKINKLAAMQQTALPFVATLEQFNYCCKAQWPFVFSKKYSCTSSLRHIHPNVSQVKSSATCFEPVPCHQQESAYTSSNQTIVHKQRTEAFKNEIRSSSCSNNQSRTLIGLRKFWQYERHSTSAGAVRIFQRQHHRYLFSNVHNGCQWRQFNRFVRSRWQRAYHFRSFGL